MGQADRHHDAVTTSEPDHAEPIGPGTVMLSPINGRAWVDADGSRWRLRGEPHAQLPVKRIEHLLHAPETRVLHVVPVEGPADVPTAEREALWQRMRPYLRDERRRPGDHTSFRVAEFRDDQRRSLLVIEESC